MKTSFSIMKFELYFANFSACGYFDRLKSQIGETDVLCGRIGA